MTAVLPALKIAADDDDDAMILLYTRSCVYELYGSAPSLFSQVQTLVAAGWAMVELVGCPYTKLLPVYESYLSIQLGRMK